jgi:predicted DNA-binding ribbon-helix-helix protein
MSESGMNNSGMSESSNRASPARLRKRSVTVAGHATSLTLEDAFWDALKAAAARRGLSVNALLARIDEERDTGEDDRSPVSLSGAVRVWLFLDREGDGG